MKKLCIVVTLQFTVSILFAQTNQKIDSTWKLNTTVAGVSCFYKIIKCNGTDAVLLGFSNQNSKPVLLSWNEKATIDGKVYDNPLGAKTFMLPIGQTIQTDCAKSEVLFISINDFGSGNTALTEFNFHNLQAHQ